MKLLFHSIVFLASIVSATAIGAVEWKSDMAAALEMARKSGKPVMINFYADWCGYCKKMKSDVYPNRMIERQLENFITVSIDGERNPQIAEDYGITGYPTVTFLDRNGVQIRKIEGYAGVEKFSSILRAVSASGDLESEIQVGLKENPENIRTNYRAGAYYFKAKQYHRARHYFLKGYSSEKEDVSGHRILCIYNAAVTSMRLEDYSSAVSYWNAYLSLSPYKNSDYAYARYYRAVAFYQLGMKKEAKEDLLYAAEYLPLPAERQSATDMLADY